MEPHEPLPVSTAPSGASLARTGLVAVLSGATLLGFSAIFVRWAALRGASPLAIGFYRMLFALPGAAFLAGRDGGLRGDRRGRAWAVSAGVAFYFDLWSWHAAMRHTSAANATLLVGGLSPIWVALASALLLGRRHRVLGWAGQGVGFAGALVLGLARGARAGSGFGEAIAIAGSLAYAAFTLALTQSRRTLSAPQALFWASLSCCACFFVAAVATGDELAGYTTEAWASLVASGLVIQLAAWWINSWGLGQIDAAAGAIALQLQQVATIVLAAALLDEPLRPLGLVGGGLLVAGIILVAASTKR